MFVQVTAKNVGCFFETQCIFVHTFVDHQELTNNRATVIGIIVASINAM